MVLGSVMGVLVTGEGVLLASMMGGWLLLERGIASYCDWGVCWLLVGGVAHYCDLERRRDVAGYYNWPVGVTRFWLLRDRSFADHLGVGGATLQVAVEREGGVTHCLTGFGEHW